MSLQIDSPLPSVSRFESSHQASIFLRGQNVDLADHFSARRGLFLGCPGAFEPRSTAFVKGFKTLATEFKAHVDFIGIVLVNDPFVVKGEFSLDCTQPGLSVTN